MSNSQVFVGKEILRLITTAMYDDPLTIYREYVQNAVDAVDSVVMKGYAKNDAKIHINLNHSERNISIIDNGPGIPSKKFSSRMKTFGWSEKRGMPLRGIWGIGRLSGLAYCKRLVFRTKAQGENVVSCMEWDGQKFKEILFASDQEMNLSEVVEQITTTSIESVDTKQPSFFEVEIDQVVRHGNDALLNEKTVSEYLAQVAPVPFHSNAPFRKQIQEFLIPHIDVSGYRIYLNKISEPICKPHRKKFIYSPNYEDRFSDIECFEIKNRKNKLVAAGWILHHSYLGTLKNSPTLRGIRMRSGNMQIGNERILSNIFPEERFNSWSVGELHILDPVLRPNGQRNNLEDSPAFREVKSKLVPIVGRAIARKCRTNSSVRNKVRLTLDRLKSIEVTLDILEANILSSTKANTVLAGIRQETTHIQSDLIEFPDTLDGTISVDTKQIFTRLKKVKSANGELPRSHGLPKAQWQLINNIADLIYDHSPDPKIAGELILEIRTFIENHQN